MEDIENADHRRTAPGASDGNIPMTKSPAMPIAPVTTSAPPTVSILAAGGCGINMLRRVIPMIKDPSTISVRRFDTSHSNIVSGSEPMIQLADGGGSGMKRQTHSDAILKKLSALDPETDLALSDVNIILYSLAGGSGSVIGPVLTKEVERRGGKAVNIVVADASSQIAVDNTLSTLRTMQSICTMDKIYLPTMVFSNVNVGRARVDVALPYRLAQLVQLITLPALEIDRSDRRNFFNGIKTVGASPGVRLLHVFAGTDKDTQDTGEVWSHEESEILDSTLSIGVVPTNRENAFPIFAANSPRARIAFSGTFRDHIVAPYLGMITSGNGGLESLMKVIGDTTAIFSSQDRNVASAIDMGDAKPSHSGLVF